MHVIFDVAGGGQRKTFCHPAQYERFTLRVLFGWLRLSLEFMMVMRRRFVLMLGALAPLSLLFSRHWRPRSNRDLAIRNHVEQARRLNQLAGRIETIADANRFVELVVEVFQDQLPPSMKSRSFRHGIAHAEFLATSDSQHLVPEWRLAEAWNAYVDTVHAPEDQKIGPAEVHNLRDAFWSIARLEWDQGSQLVWTVPSIYATLPDGGLARGCRPVESIRILWDLANLPQNLQGARERVRDGVLLSDRFRQAQHQQHPSSEHAYLVIGPAISRPMELPQRQYIARNGRAAFHDALIAMVDRALASS